MGTKDFSVLALKAICICLGMLCICDFVQAQADAGLSQKSRVIVIDPGHGGEDLGAVGPDGILEKDIVLAVAKRLAAVLHKDTNLVVRLTRGTDLAVGLSERTNIANDYEAALFVSLHANASPAKRVTGIETFYLDNTDDLSSRRLAERENSSLRFENGGGDLNFILSDLIQSSKVSDSKVLARLVQSQIIKELRVKWKDVKDLGVKKAPFYVLVGAHMPCILVELSFIDHPVEGMRLANQEYQAALVRALAKAIMSYLKIGVQ